MGEVNGVVNGVIEEEERVHEWEAGLPNIDDITPLNHGLISPELLSAFNIKPEPYRSNGDLSRACQDTISSIRGQSPATNFKSFDENQQIIAEDEEIDVDGGGGGEEAQPEDDGSDTKKPRRNESPEDADSAAAKTLKRPRLVWTPQLHKRFVDVVTHLGIKNAVPKTIMQLMNVEGLTRENVASHLQKYRLYLKRMQGVSFDAPSSSSPAAPLLAPENLMSSENGSRSGSGNGNGPVPMPYAPTPMLPVPMPMMGMGMAMGDFNGFEPHHNHYNFQNHHHQYNNGSMQSGSGTKYGSVASYHQHHHHHPPHVAPGDK